jgi:hypothetical protein
MLNHILNECNASISFPSGMPAPPPVVHLVFSQIAQTFHYSSGPGKAKPQYRDLLKIAGTDMEPSKSVKTDAVDRGIMLSSP